MPGSRPSDLADPNLIHPGDIVWLDSSHLTFTTRNVHGTWFTFDGTLGRGSGKKPEEEGYYVIRGTLNRFRGDADKKNTGQDSRNVEFKSFPRDVTP